MGGGTWEFRRAKADGTCREAGVNMGDVDAIIGLPANTLLTWLNLVI